ncbi:PDZ domain-containing protein [Glaciimonas sp. GS1]|uniref:PDZ domain-containing protein n=1 Tax=Glaciimonas soli TaxID=2590999 RepID=A0A843YQC2_9BURK|nr:PDZ domain-containing protein [Glaciimonas soli]
MASSLCSQAQAAVVSPCPPDWEAQICELKSVVEVLKKEHLTEIDMSAFLDETIRLGVRTLPYANFRNAQEQQEQIKKDQRTRNGTPGIGIIFDTLPDGLHIVDVVPDGPAAQAGIRTGDTVVAMNGNSLIGVDNVEISKYANGEVGAPLKITLLRGVSKQRLELTLVRAIIKLRPAVAKIIDGNVLYTRLANFPEPTIGDYINVIQVERKKRLPIKAVILDLRLNGGGALNAAIGITALFTGRNKTAMVTLQRDDKTQHRITTNWPDYELPVMQDQDPLASLQADDWWRSVPLIVLIDGQSASAAEATAAALKDLGRAKLLGTPSYGKGMAQTGVGIRDDTYLVWTNARNFRPNGCPMEGYGVIPDWIVPPRKDADIEGILLNHREVDIPRPAFADIASPDPFANVRKERQRLRDQRDLSNLDKTGSVPLPQKEFTSNKDWQLKQALNALAGKAVQTVSVNPRFMPPRPVCIKLDE